MAARSWRWLGAVLGIALLALVAWRLVQFRAQLTLDWRTLSWPLLAGALACACAAQLAFATAWHALLARGAAGTWAHDAARWSLSLAGKYLPGKVFQAVLRLGAYRGSPAGARVAPALLREMSLSVGAACAWVALHLSLSSAGPRGLLWPMVAGAVLLGVAALPVAARPLAWLLARVMPRRDDHPTPLAPAHLASAWLLQLAGYFLLGLAVWLLARAIAPAHAPGLLAAVGGLCFAGVAGVAAFVVPAGIGVREAALAWYLAAWLPAGPAALLAIAARLCLTLAEGLAIAIGLARMRMERP